MDFTLTEAQRELAALTRKILDSSEAPWQDLVKSGVVPEDPAEFGVLEHCAVLVELGRAVARVPRSAPRRDRALFVGSARPGAPVHLPVRRRRRLPRRPGVPGRDVRAAGAPARELPRRL